MAMRRSAPLPQLRAKAVETMRAVTPENSVVYYTDGSVDAERRTASAAFVTQDTRQGVRVLGTRCSMQAEGIAVGLALTHALNTHQSHVVIHTDSLSLIQSIHNDVYQDYVQLMTSLLFQIRSLHEQGRIVVLNWIPGHIGLPGNEEADSEARKAAANHHMDGGIGVLPSRAEILTIATRTLTRREIEKHKLMTPMRPSALWYKRTSNYEKFATGMRLSRAQEVIRPGDRRVPKRWLPAY
ncbi:ribonuclease H1-like [Oratosquilla oratoria]|uniref:ribonuclease H1-like n=1 Tax=Oratosquilla oratoria TaxID=337810 RepID=UPI003F767B43